MGNTASVRALALAPLVLLYGNSFAQAANEGCEIFVQASNSSELDITITMVAAADGGSFRALYPEGALAQLGPRESLDQALPDGRLAYDCSDLSDMTVTVSTRFRNSWDVAASIDLASEQLRIRPSGDHLLELGDVSSVFEPLFAPYLANVPATGTPAASAPDNGSSPLRTLYSLRFSTLAEGDFPADLTFRGGSMQIDNSQGDAMLRFEGGSWFHIALDDGLPEDFAIEFDYFTNESYAVLFISAFDAAMSGQTPPSYSGYRQGPFNYFALANTVVGVAIDSSSQGLPKANAQNGAFTNGVARIRLEARGDQARVFVDGDQAVVNPSATLLRSNVIEFFYGSVGSPGNGYLGNIRVLAL